MNREDKSHAILEPVVKIKLLCLRLKVTFAAKLLILNISKAIGLNAQRCYINA
jgi:hypothetical protein